MKHEMMSMGDLLGGRVISVNPPKCENCRNDAAGTRCVKLDVYGGRMCVAKGGVSGKKKYVAPAMEVHDAVLGTGVHYIGASGDPHWGPVPQAKERGWDGSDGLDGDGCELWE